MINNILEKLCEGIDLSEVEIDSIFSLMMEGSLSDTQAASFLTALKIKKPSAEEIFFASNVLLKNIDIAPPHSFDLLDLCGTGGDSKSTLNVSTISSLILASLGVKIAKHGNRSVSSKVGSADLIESLGISLDNSLNDSLKSIKKNNFSFLYAPNFHKSMKNVGHIRKELKMRTIFNILGPLVNPLRPKSQVMGVYDKDLMLVMAKVLQKQGVKRAMVVHGFDGMDEISICSNTYIAEIAGDDIHEYEFSPEEYGFKLSSISSLVISSPEESKLITEGIFNNTIQDSRRDICILNAGAGLYVSGNADSLEDAFFEIESKITSGEINSNFIKILG